MTIATLIGTFVMGVGFGWIAKLWNRRPYQLPRYVSGYDTTNKKELMVVRSAVEGALIVPLGMSSDEIVIRSWLSAIGAMTNAESIKNRRLFVDVLDEIDRRERELPDHDGIDLLTHQILDAHERSTAKAEKAEQAELLTEGS